MQERILRVRRLGVVDYLDTWKAMRAFTARRDESSDDELWLLQHPPVFTQGQAGRPEHVLARGEIPLIQTDRGGQVTYHGPGQLLVYPLLNLRRLRLGVRDLVTHLEQAVVELLATFAVRGAARADAPGVYVGGKKIASLGLRVRKGCSLHGVAINVDADLSPFALINPCGHAALEMVNLQALAATDVSLARVAELYTEILAGRLSLRPVNEDGLAK